MRGINWLLVLVILGLAFRGDLFAIPEISARSAVLFDANTGRVLFKKNENQRMPVASTQKLLTALLVVENGDLDRLVTIKASDTMAEPTKLYLSPGDRYTRRALTTALLVKSPNDVALALARDHSGSVSAFARAMNLRMRRLGGVDSNFVNPNGLPAPNQYSTARDMARVARAAYFNSEIRRMVGTRFYSFRFASGKTRTLRNTNRLLLNYPFCNGMKTGYTLASGHCLVSSASWRGRDVIAVVLGSTKSKIWDDSLALLSYGLGLSAVEVQALSVAQKGN